MKTSTAMFLTLATMAIVFVVYTEANLILKSTHKKGKDIIYLGKKCEPTIIKTTGKKGKGDIIIMKPDCKKKEPHYVIMPVIHEHHDKKDYGHKEYKEHKDYGHKDYGHKEHYGDDHYGHYEDDHHDHYGHYEHDDHYYHRR